MNAFACPMAPDMSQDPNNLPVTQTYIPRDGLGSYVPGNVAPPNSPHPPAAHFYIPHGHYGMMPLYMPPYLAGQPLIPAMPGAYPHQQFFHPGPIHAFPVHIPPVVPLAHHLGLTANDGNVHPGGAACSGAAPSEEFVCLGRTAEEVAAANFAESFNTGANKPNAEIMPYNPAEDDMFWVIETDGHHTLRTFMSITLSCQPGKWQQDPNGALYFMRHPEDGQA